VLVSLEFKIADQAHAFAERFGGRADPASAPPRATIDDVGSSSTGVIG
jgi:hypothetical protein